MRRRTSFIPALLAGLMLASPAEPQAAPADREVLERVAETYRGLKRYLFQGDIRVELRSPSNPQSHTVPFLVAVDGTGRIRDEATGGPGPGLIVSDGRETVIYNGQLGQYVRKAGSADIALGTTANRGVGSMLVARFADVARGVVDVRRLPNEPITLDGVRRDCLVLDVTYEPQPQPMKVTEQPRRFWIDAKTRLVLRMRSRVSADAPQLGGKVQQEETVTFRRVWTNPVFADSLWAFRPPPASREVSEFGGNATEGAGFTGKPAIDFSLNDLHGRPHSLSDLRGKTVLLDFWATWCGPCRITMPQVAKIHAEYKDRGVEVMSINVGESAKRAGDYMAKNGYAFTTLLDEEREVAASYRINGIPTLIVIDAAGNVTDYMVGVRDDVALRAALRKAGVN
ncbi:MAG: redoxin domain-containing protein [Candidatus Eiseniibacteriota bacterium]